MSETTQNQKERLTFPRRGLIIGLLMTGLALFWLISGKTDFGYSSRKIEGIKVQNQVLPRVSTRSEIIKQADGSWLVKWTGEGENGFRLPDLPPAGYSLRWLQGKIVYSANGHSFPLWGADVYYQSNLRYFHLRDKGIRPHQVILVKGNIGSGEEELIPFRPGKTQIFFRLDGQPVYLFYHYITGLYNQFGWDGSYAIFELRRIE